MRKTLFTVLLLAFYSSLSASAREKTIEDLLEKTSFLEQATWVAAPVQEEVVFLQKGRSLPGRLSIVNDKKAIYLLLIVRGDDFVFEKDAATGRWADDRLFIVLDENGDKIFTEQSEDRLGVFLREARSSGASLTCSDWYYHDEKRKWEEDRGGSQKKAVFFCTGSCENGEVQDIAIEIKIPINSGDRDDLKVTPGDVIGIGLMYGNLRDGYASFPRGIFPSPDESPSGFLQYQIRE